MRFVRILPYTIGKDLGKSSSWYDVDGQAVFRKKNPGLHKRDNAEIMFSLGHGLSEGLC